MMVGLVESVEKLIILLVYCFFLCYFFLIFFLAKMVSLKYFLEFKFFINKCLYWFILIINCYILYFDDFYRFFVLIEFRWFKKYFVCLYRKRNNLGMFDDVVILMYGFIILDFMEDFLFI